VSVGALVLGTPLLVLFLHAVTEVLNTATGMSQLFRKECRSPLVKQGSLSLMAQ
jgi:hypothetical protein